ncbi:GNAT family N-acetyltransferase [Brevibacillus choshinensis]|uniref:GNAT family N-acetyltransferase n=1 Tax=Brevibacillus choshinensis TaxID=54911 RepID=A0ABX7FWD1_BRECH|nr:GNAT family N-acetyltransferase [Brevibacillus choshinensis]QRG70163.1 GNAT family N-acetyltransferase [Brevibacillus choshinensis]
METIYRRANREDAYEMARLSTQLGYSVLPTELKERVKAVQAAPHHIIFVAEQHNRLVGWIHAHERLLIESAPFVEIGGFIVDAACRGQGVGKKLVRLCEEWASGEGYAKIRVRTNTSREDAQAFYSRLGYQSVKAQQVYDKKLET